MTQRNTHLWESTQFREIVGAVGVLIILVVFTEMTLQTIIPLVIVIGGVTGHNIAEERYDLPNGTNWLVYGSTVIIAGAYFALLGGSWTGSLLVIAGCWFAFDGMTTVQYKPDETTHEYVSEINEKTNKVMLRMQTVNSVYHQLKNVREPQTTAELATDLDLTESRTESALDFLDSKGRVEQVENRYRAEPPQWGRLTPAVQFFSWLPKRILRPFRLVAVNI